MRLGNLQAVMRAEVGLAAICQHETGESPGQCRLANPLRTGKQPGVMDTAGAKSLEQFVLGVRVAKEIVRLARMGEALKPIGLRQCIFGFHDLDAWLPRLAARSSGFGSGTGYRLLSGCFGRTHVSNVSETICQTTSLTASTA